MNFVINEEDHLAHYGILRKSGRYPWGSGESETQRSKDFISTLADLRSKGMSDVDIAKGFGMTIRELRETNTIARNQKKASDIAYATQLKFDKGYSNVAIGEKMGINESSVRSLLAEAQKERNDILTTTANMIRDDIETHGGYLDIGKGVENHLGVSKEKLGSAIAILKGEDYQVLKVQVDQAGTSNKTTLKLLCPPGTTYRDVKLNMDKIRQLNQVGVKSDDGGRTFFGLLPPKSLDSSRIAVAYKEDGGDKADGVMFIRPGKEDLSLGGSSYAQVRVLVDGTHYLKGMAMYKNDLPKGVDVMFNTNKSDTGNKLDALKKITDDPDNPFGAMVDQIGKHDASGNLTELTSVMNLVNKEGDWDGWRKSIASQVLSKQSPKLAKKQLDEAFAKKKADLDEIKSLTNPAIKKKLLEAYATSADSSSVHMKAASLPRQRAQVILPINSLKDTEIYAPNFRNGERVALIRYPHGGTFEIPELTVNNNHPEAKSLLGQAADAVAINSKVAEHLSGADFDGDAVLVIPNNNRELKTQPALEKLKNFDPQRDYKLPEGQEFRGNKQQLMGDVSNLITDMTIKGANNNELAAAVRHSMVVIDAEKHNLDWQRSARDNGIVNLKKKYQGAGNAGASTLISRAKSRQDVVVRRPRPMSKGGPIDRATGKKMFEPKPDAAFIDPKTGQERFRMQRSTKLAEADNAHDLVSANGGTAIERVYADHSNRMKALANEARREVLSVPNLQQSSSAKEVYKTEIAQLNAKLNVALRNSPVERQAQLFAHAVVSSKRASNPNMDSAQIKKANAQALATGRARFGAKKELVDITDREWEAIQAGAISNFKLKQILDNTDIDRVRELATPRAKTLMSGAKLSKARALAESGHTQAEIADALGISLSTLKEGLKNG